MTAPQRGRIGGFTLLELLVSMAVGVVLIFLLTEALRSTQEGWIRATKQDQRLAQELRAEELLRGLLTTLQPPVPDDLGRKTPASDGMFEFVTLPRQSQAAQGPMRAILAVEADRLGLLDLGLDLNPVIGDRPSPISHHKLLAGLAWAEFAYYYSGKDALTTSPPLDGSGPALIVIRWSYPDDRNDISEIAVRPRVSMSGECTLDLSSGRCRTP